MKKITAKQYAISLYESLKEARGEEIRKRIANFLIMIKKRKDLKLLNKIFQNFIKIYQEQEGILTTEIITAKPLTEKVKEEIIKWLKKFTNRTATLEEKIDSKILGGIIIKFNETILDTSLKSQLKKLQQSLIQ